MLQAFGAAGKELLAAGNRRQRSRPRYLLIPAKIADYRGTRRRPLASIGRLVWRI
jgi:hypothetical protein